MKSVICEEVARLCQQVYREGLRAVVLTGSLARNEATFVKDDEGALLLGDAEFLLVFGNGATLPTSDDLRLIRQQIEERVRRRGLRADITLTAGPEAYLRALPPSIFAYELRTCGETLAGDAGALALIPDFSPADVPLEDAWRLLANRLVEQIEGVPELLERRPTLSPKLHYRTVKLYLDMATSLLVFAGGYAPTYEERARALALLRDAEPSASRAPFALQDFCAEVGECTRWKLGAVDPGGDVPRAFWERAMAHANALWRWELVQLAGDDDAGAPDRTLMARWMRRQPLSARVRGWAHIVRQAGWSSSWSRWPAWARLALRTSPRYAVYATATELLFGLRTSSGAAHDGGGANAQDQDVIAQLPVAPRSKAANGGRTWTDIADDVLFNYHEFLVNTRS